MKAACIRLKMALLGTWLTLAAGLWPGALHAECGTFAFAVWPRADTIPPTPMLLLEGYAQAQEIVMSMNSRYPAYLVSGSEKIRLKVLDTLRGEYYLCQVLLKPEKALTVGRSYSLLIEGLTAWQQQELSWWDRETRIRRHPRWRVVATKAAPPAWDSIPHQVEAEYQGYEKDWMPLRQVIFQTHVRCSLEHMVLVSLASAEQHLKPVRYYLPIERGLIHLGHEECMGPFILYGSRLYQVEFMLMSVDGKYSDPSEVQEFSGPRGSEKLYRRMFMEE